MANRDTFTISHINGQRHGTITSTTMEKYIQWLTDFLAQRGKMIVTLTIFKDVVNVQLWDGFVGSIDQDVIVRKHIHPIQLNFLKAFIIHFDDESMAETKLINTENNNG